MRVTLLLVMLSFVIPVPARAFCGCMVRTRAGGSGRALVNEASMVVIARDGDRTVLSMRNDYRGPPEDFALVVPIPTSIEERDVRTLDDAVFERLDRLTAPRLYDYYERDPCWSPNFPTPGSGDRDMGLFGFLGFGGPMGSMIGGTGGRRSRVDVESRFAVDEYDIVVLGASDSGALEAWLTSHDYHVPEGFAEAVRPYAEAGSRFFVARIDAERLELDDGHALLSPLRISYRSEEFALPIRLGRLNSDGEQDVVVHIIAPDSRYVVAGVPHATIPTHYRVDESVRPSFEDFYEALFAATLERHPGAVITEWVAQVGGEGAWDTALDPVDLHALTGSFLPPPLEQLHLTNELRVDGQRLRVSGPLEMDVVERVLTRHANEMRYCYELAGANGGDVDLSFVINEVGTVQSAHALGETPRINACLARSARRWTFPAPEERHVVDVTYQLESPLRREEPETREEAPHWDSSTPLVLTRLHHRYGDEQTEDLVFVEAEPITGGTYAYARGEEGPWMVRAARAHERNQFEARYFVGHEYEGAINCGDQGVRGVWVPGWTGGEEVIGPYFGMVEDDAPPPLEEIVLESIFREDVPELELTARQTMDVEEEEPPTTLVPVVGAQPAEDDGCGCRVGPQRGSIWQAALVLAALALLLRRRRG